MYEADGMPGSDGCISEGLSDEALAHADRSDEQDVLVAVQELEGEGGVYRSRRSSVRCGPVEVFEAAGLLEAGPLEADSSRLWSLRLISSVSMICRKDAYELLPACESDPLRQGVEHGAELEALEQRGEFSRGGHERSPCAE